MKTRFLRKKKIFEGRKTRHKLEPQKYKKICTTKQTSFEMNIQCKHTKILGFGFDLEQLT